MTWSDLKDIITGLAGIAAVVIAYLGLQTWRKQLRGKTEYDLARSLYRKVLEVRDAIVSARHPFVSGGEIQAAAKKAGLELVSEDDRADEVVYNERWSRVASAISDMQVDLLEAEVLWGTPAKEAGMALQHCGVTLFAALKQHVSHGKKHSRYRSPEAEERAAAFFEKNAAVVFAGTTVPDTFAVSLDTAVARFEDLLRPRLKIT